MKDVLTEIVANKISEIQEAKAVLPTSKLERIVADEDNANTASMSKSLLASPTGIIAEFKRKSPSRGWISQAAKPEDVCKAYEQAGASALSILTDRKFFGGYPEYIQRVRAVGVSLPVLYKNFVIDEWQLLMARHAGASAVLLIAACLQKKECARLMAAAHELGQEVLLEMHSEQELEYAELEPDMCGINNRNLGSFVTDVENSFRLAEKLPKESVKVSESGISSPDTIKQLRQAGYNGFLIGGTFMEKNKPGEELARFINQLK